MRVVAGAEGYRGPSVLVSKVLSVAMALLGLWTGNYLLPVVAVFVYALADQELRAEQARHALEDTGSDTDAA